jgi:hypothetical protein
MTKRQVPRGPEDLKCPWWKKTMDQVCHVCPLWVKIEGAHPQTGERIDEWNCSFAFAPILLVENSLRQKQTAAAVDKVANEVKQGADQQMLAAISALRQPLAEAGRQIANGNGAYPLMIEQD